MPDCKGQRNLLPSMPDCKGQRNMLCRAGPSAASAEKDDQKPSQIHPKKGQPFLPETEENTSVWCQTSSRRTSGYLKIPMYIAMAGPLYLISKFNSYVCKL